MAQTPDVKIGSRDKSVPWYDAQLGELSGSARDLLENYSHIPSQEVVPHIMKMRDIAWEIFPYPCVGGFRFIDLAIGMHPLYAEILERMKTGNQTYLDLGCCFGQDIRRLVYDGVPSEKCYGTDLKAEFWDLGYQLFLDKDTLRSKFVGGDAFDPSTLRNLDGQIDIIHSSSFFHLFSLEQQKEIARLVVRLLKPQKGSLLVGRQVGNEKGGEELDNKTGPRVFRHDPHTWAQMWDDIGRETGTQWEAWAELGAWPRGTEKMRQWQRQGARRIVFSVRRL